MRRIWSRLRRIAGIPSGLVFVALFAFYLLINAVSWQTAQSAGAYGVWAAVAAAVTLTAVLFIRWQRQVADAVAPALERPGSTKLAVRRGVVMLVGLDSAEPGTTFLRLLATAGQLEYLALVASPQATDRGVVDRLLAMPERVGRPLSHERVRVWDDSAAEVMADTEQAVTEAIAWMLRHELHPSQIVVDVTKGRRTMQFGALIAAARAQVELQYLASDWHHLDDRPRSGSAEFTVVHEHWDNVGPDADPRG